MTDRQKGVARTRPHNPHDRQFQGLVIGVFALTFVLACLRLEGIIDWPWVAVVAPLLVPAGLFIAFCVYVAVHVLTAPEQEP